MEVCPICQGKGRFTAIRCSACKGTGLIENRLGEEPIVANKLYVSIPKPLIERDILTAAQSYDSMNKLIDDIAERIATVLEDRYRVYENNRPDLDLVPHNELTQTIKEAIRTK